MRKTKNSDAYLQHISTAIKKIEEYLSSHDYAHFSMSEWDQDAIMRNLEIIGEAANHIDADVRSSYPDIAWKDIIGLRNILIHQYMDVDIDIIWRIITHDLPLFHQKISSASRV